LEHSHFYNLPLTTSAGFVTRKKIKTRLLGSN